jgi:hypothetical protein
MKQDIEGAVFRLDSKSEGALEPAFSEDYKVNAEKVYALFGKHDELDQFSKPVLKDRMIDEKYEYAKDRVDACAMEQLTNRGSVYLIKISNFDGNLYNPNGIYSFEQRQKANRQKGGMVFTFRRVSKPVFDHYLRFLETGNASHLTVAQREMM